MFLSARPKYLAALTLVIGVFLASHAFGTEKPVKDAPQAVANGGYANAEASADADSNAVSVSDAHASQNQYQEANASNDGNHQSTTFKSVKQAPSAYASASNATIGCFKPRGVSASIPGVGAGFTGGKLDKDCLLLTAADEELRRGNLSASIAFRCKTKLYQETLGEDCIALLNTQTAKKEEAKVDLSSYATKEELNRAFKAATSK